MSDNINFQKKMDEDLKRVGMEILQGKEPPTLLLHSCCAPCSSYVLEYLASYFRITVLFYNPNISEEKEYQKRVKELRRLLEELPVRYSVKFMEGKYTPQEFYDAVRGFEHLGERSKRCYECYHLRMEYAAKIAKKQGFDYFTTTLSISPHKNAKWLNEIGKQLSEQYETSYLYADFKKKNGYKRSIELSAKYHLYRQDFCGCAYSKAEEAMRKNSLGDEV